MPATIIHPKFATLVGQSRAKELLSALRWRPPGSQARSDCHRVGWLGWFLSGCRVADEQLQEHANLLHPRSRDCSQRGPDAER